MNRIKKYTLTIIPLIITTILIFYGYISAYNSFFYKYSNLIINSNSDYGIFLSGNTILQEEALDSSSLLRKANLEKMSFIGFLNMNLFFKEKMFSNVTIFFASNSYFSLYTSLSPVTGDFFLSSNFKDKLDLELNKEIDIRFQSGTEFNKSTSFDLNNYIKIDNIFESLEFLTDELTLNNFNEYFCLFLASDLDNFFAEDASLFDINTLVLFEFKESWLEKQSPKEIKEKLYEQQKHDNTLIWLFPNRMSDSCPAYADVYKAYTHPSSPELLQLVMAYNPGTVCLYAHGKHVNFISKQIVKLGYKTYDISGGSGTVEF